MMNEYKLFYKELLEEAKYERYIPVLTGKSSGNEAYDIEHVKGAVRELKRDDIIQWYLRWTRYLNLKKTPEFYKYSGREMNNPQAKWLNDFENKVSKQSPEWKTKQHGTSIRGARELANLTHFLSLPIDKIQNFRFLYQDPREVQELFQKYEAEWKEAHGEESQWIDMTEEFNDGSITEIYKFPDNFSWVNLGKSYCGQEGDAMGHCGNKGAWKSSDTVLSLRKLQKRGNKLFGRPSLTFILDTKTDSLGETKGRSNEKPAESYHPYIIKLLELKKPDGTFLIKSVSGGGYKAENNFHIEDLSVENEKKLFSVRPDLKPIDLIYKEEGLTENFKKILFSKLDPSMLSLIRFGHEKPTANGGKTVTIFVKSWADWEDLLDAIPSYPKNIEHYKDYIKGDKVIHMDFNDPDESTIKDFYSDIEDDSRFKIPFQKYLEELKERYGHDVVESHIEEDTLFEFLYEIEDAVIDQIKTAINRGEEAGSDSQMNAAFLNGISNMEFVSDSMDFPYEFQLVYEDPSNRFASPISQVWDLSDFVIAVKSGIKKFHKIFEDSSVDYSINGDMDIPYYGFSDYDEKYAKMEFFDNLSL